MSNITFSPAKSLSIMKEFIVDLPWRFYVFLLDHAPLWFPKVLLHWIEILVTPSCYRRSIDEIKDYLERCLVSNMKDAR
jgi:hypothetical protein